jgi:hypothetical protein
MIPHKRRRRRIPSASPRARHYHRSGKIRRPETRSRRRLPGRGAGRCQPSRSPSILSERKSARRAYTLANNNVYIRAWASSCDVDPYHGWVMAYDAQTLAQKAVLQRRIPTAAKPASGSVTQAPPLDSEGNLLRAHRQRHIRRHQLEAATTATPFSSSTAHRSPSATTSPRSIKNRSSSQAIPTSAPAAPRCSPINPARIGIFCCNPRSTPSSM